MADLKEGIKRYVKFYNIERFHQSLGYLMPEQVYNSKFVPLEVLDNGYDSLKRMALKSTLIFLKYVLTKGRSIPKFYILKVEQFKL